MAMTLTMAYRGKQDNTVEIVQEKEARHEET